MEKIITAAEKGCTFCKYIEKYMNSFIWDTTVVKFIAYKKYLLDIPILGLLPVTLPKTVTRIHTYMRLQSIVRPFAVFVVILQNKLLA